jgi:hypothetical protein
VNRLAAAAGVIAAGAVSLLLLAPREPAPATAVAPQPARQPVAVAPRPAITAATPATPEPPRDVVLHGVVMRGAQSQALLSVGGRSQEPYAIGDAVEGGWTVHAIREQQVVLANAGAQSVVNVASAAAAPATADAVAPASSAPRLPGFVAGAPAPFTDAGASERNRRFLDAVHARRNTAP